LGDKIFQGVHAFCFYNKKLIVVYADSKGHWGPPGGHIEKGESYEEAVIREVLEETNMRVLKQELIGYQDVYEKEPKQIIRQTRSFCLVEPVGDFVSDPDGDDVAVTYFGWMTTNEKKTGYEHCRFFRMA